MNIQIIGNMTHIYFALLATGSILFSMAAHGVYKNRQIRVQVMSILKEDADSRSEHQDRY